MAKCNQLTALSFKGLTLSPPIPLRLYTSPYWSNPPERPNVKIENGGLDQHGAGPFEWQQFGTAGVEGIKIFVKIRRTCSFDLV